MSDTLAGRGIVITRPAGQTQRLSGLVKVAGGVPLCYPAIEISDVADEHDVRTLDHAIDHLDKFDLAIFVSPSAVDKAMLRISARRTLPANLHYAAIGPGGVQALHRHGIADVIAPEARHDSEGLLSAPFMRNVRGKRMVIFRGDGGRELLADTLAARGALVEPVTCYRRVCPRWDAQPLLQDWSRGAVAAAIVTSSEGLQNFCSLLGAPGMALLRATPLVVPHPRIVAAARELGLQQVVESASGDAAMMTALVEHLSTAVP